MLTVEGGHCFICHQDWQGPYHQSCGGTPTPCGPMCSMKYNQPKLNEDAIHTIGLYKEQLIQLKRERDDARRERDQLRDALQQVQAEMRQCINCRVSDGMDMIDTALQGRDGK